MKFQKFITTIFIISGSLSYCLAQNKMDLALGRWEGESLADNRSMKFEINITKSANQYRGSYSSPDQRALDIPLRNLRLDSAKNEISFSLAGDADTWNFKGRITNNKINGVILKGTQKATFILKKQAIKAPLYSRKEVEFWNDTVKLSGTLYVPETNRKLPAIIFLHGSGPEPGTAASFYGDYFAKKGIAVLTYDKRGVNKSTGNWRTATFNDLAEDAIAGFKLLETIPQIDKTKIGVYGHSQGGSICPLVLTKYPKLAFGISAASAGVSMEESDWYEVQNRFKKYVTGEDYDHAMEVMDKYLQFASRGTGYEELMQAAKKYDTTKWYQNFIGDIDTSSYFFSFYRKIGRYNAVVYWRSVKQPVLILKGENDLTSPGYPSFANIENALQLAQNRNYKIVMFPNTTHEMHLVGKPTDFWFRATPGYCETIFVWLKQNIIDK